MQIVAGGDGQGLRVFDPGYLNTAPVRSTISYIDGDKGILRYRGYPIEELAEKSSFLEVAYLLSEYLLKNQIISSAKLFMATSRRRWLHKSSEFRKPWFDKGGFVYSLGTNC